MEYCGKVKRQNNIILTTHYLEEAEALSDRIAIMSKGELKAIGTAKELMESTNTEKFEDAFIAYSSDGGAIL